MEQTFVMYGVLEKSEGGVDELFLKLCSKEKLPKEYSYCCGPMFTKGFMAQQKVEKKEPPQHNPLYYATEDQLRGKSGDYVMFRLRLMQHVIEEVVEDRQNIDQWAKSLESVAKEMNFKSSDLFVTVDGLPAWIPRACHFLVNGASGDAFLAFYPKAKSILNIIE